MQGGLNGGLPRRPLSVEKFVEFFRKAAGKGKFSALASHGSRLLGGVTRSFSKGIL
jgi:hypothetical protein